MDRDSVPQVLKYLVGDTDSDHFLRFPGRPPNMRRRENLVEREQRVTRWGRLFLEHVERGSGDLARLDGLA